MPESPTSSKSAIKISAHRQKSILPLSESNQGSLALRLTNKKEWDGFLRVCFIIKNKTLRSIFKQKSVLLMLEKNYKTLQAVLASLQNNGSNGEAALNTAMDLGGQSLGIEDDDNEMDDDDMEMDEGEGDRGETSEFKEGRWFRGEEIFKATTTRVFVSSFAVQQVWYSLHIVL